MSTGKVASYPWYPRDWLADTMTLTLVERGAYRELLDYQWMHGAVPSDPADLAGILRVTKREATKLWQRLKEYFPEGLNRRLEREREASEERVAIASSNGKRGAEARWGKNRKHRQPGSDPNGDPNGERMAGPSIRHKQTDGKTMASVSVSVKQNRQFSEHVQKGPVPVAETLPAAVAAIAGRRA